MFAAQGLTDPLFPGIQLLQEINRLTAAYPSYPVWAAAVASRLDTRSRP